MAVCASACRLMFGGYHSAGQTWLARTVTLFAQRRLGAGLRFDQHLWLVLLGARTMGCNVRTYWDPKHAQDYLIGVSRAITDSMPNFSIYR